MKHTVEVTERQRMALCTLLAEYMRQSELTALTCNSFLDCSQEPPVETTVSELLDLFMRVEARKEVPEVGMQQILDAGLNAFGLQLFAESVAGKKDATTFKPFSFKFRNIKIALEPDGVIDTRHH